MKRTHNTIQLNVTKFDKCLQFKPSSSIFAWSRIAMFGKYLFKIQCYGGREFYFLKELFVSFVQVIISNTEISSEKISFWQYSFLMSVKKFKCELVLSVITYQYLRELIYSPVASYLAPCTKTVLIRLYLFS